MRYAICPLRYDRCMAAPLIIAHRTCPLDAPENSLEGIRKAAELGADGVEIDLRMSLDFQPFLLHDYSLHRTTGFWLPLELTPSFIVRRLRLKGSAEAVPSLDAALDALPPSLLLAVDVKTPWAVIPLIKTVKRRGLESRVLIWCTSAWAARYAARHAPDVEVAYLKTALDDESRRIFLERAGQAGARAVSAHWQAIDSDFVGRAHALGLRVSAWHERDALDSAKLASGLDILITDYPVEARAALAGL
jgi:glycerophosphoryl diester phosphodiesterase